MSAKHTLGPWHAKAGITQMCDPDATTVARGRPHGNEGAFWWIFSPANEHGDAEADALLMAAAPELLSLLQETLQPGAYGIGSTLAARIEAAIAKATGEAA